MYCVMESHFTLLKARVNKVDFFLFPTFLRWHEQFCDIIRCNISSWQAYRVFMFKDAKSIECWSTIFCTSCLSCRILEDPNSFTGKNIVSCVCTSNISLVSSTSLLLSLKVRHHRAHALSDFVMPIIPPATFPILFTCFRAGLLTAD